MIPKKFYKFNKFICPLDYGLLGNIEYIRAVCLEEKQINPNEELIKIMAQAMARLNLNSLNTEPIVSP